MAHIRKRTLRGGKLAYQARWVDPDGAEQSEQFDRWEDANDKCISVEHSKRVGSYVDTHAGKVRFRSYASQWLSNQVHRTATAKQYETALRLHVFPALGDRPVSAIRRSDVAALVKRLSVTYSARTVRSSYAVVQLVFSAAVLDHMIARTPCEQIKLPKITPVDIVIPTVDQVTTIAGSVPPGLDAMVMFAATSGLRLGELMGVTLDSVNFFAREVTVRPDRGQLVHVKGVGARLVPPKSTASARTIPLGDVAMATLTEHLRVRPANRDDGFGGLVFQSPLRKGGPIAHAWVHSKLAPVLAAHGFASGTGMHVFRHFYASALIAANASAKVVQMRLGHATISETFDTYGHLWPDDDETSRTAIDAAFEIKPQLAASLTSSDPSS